MSRISSEILIVGSGPAGLAAAMVVYERSSVTIVDDNPYLGGQIWRAELGKTKNREAQRLLNAVQQGRVEIINNTQILAISGNQTLLGETPEGTTEFAYEKLIIATGARERFLPFPGWTLPGVFGAGGLQALVKGGLDTRGQRIGVAGTGPLLLAVAAYLKSKGAKIVTIAEQTSAAKLRRFASGLWRSPSKLTRAAVLRSKIIGVPYLTDCWVTATSGSGKLERVQLTRKGKQWSVDCDMLACGYDLVPNIELAELLGCKIESGFVAVDEFQRTSQPNIFCAGEPTGIGGVEASVAEGTIAGFVASARQDAARKLFPKRDRTQNFSEMLNAAFTLREELKSLPAEDTIVCRCEDVTYDRLKKFSTFRDAKLQTRCGMGPCQGRVCGSATQFLFGWERPGVRPPIFPVKMENL